MHASEIKDDIYNEWKWISQTTLACKCIWKVNAKYEIKKHPAEDTWNKNWCVLISYVEMSVYIELWIMYKTHEINNECIKHEDA